MTAQLCAFDVCELYNGLLLGLLSSLLASSVTYLWMKRQEQRRLRKKYVRLEGEYDGYARNKTSLTREDQPQSNATIRYMMENRLSITLTEFNLHNSRGDRLQWAGDIHMEFETFGTVAWRYLNFDGKHQFGFKRCIVREEEGKSVIYLVGEEKHGQPGEEPYGIEILIPKNKQLEAVQDHRRN